MLRNWKWIGSQTVLAGALLAVPVNAAEEPDPNKVILNRLEEIRKELKNDLQDLKNDRVITDAKAEEALRKIKELSVQIENLDRDVKDLKSKTRVSMFPPTEAGTGRLKLVNTFSTEARIFVNGKSYPLGPGETRMSDPIPSGNFTYEVLVDGFGAVQAPRTRMIAPNEVFEIKIHPR